MVHLYAMLLQKARQSADLVDEARAKLILESLVLVSGFVNEHLNTPVP